MILKKTKIVCTLGPASANPKILREMIQNGMDVARLNFSHGTHEEKHERAAQIRQLSDELKKPIAIIADIQGPKLRLGEIEGIRQITKGETLELSISAKENQIPTQFDLAPHVKRDQRIFLNDGLVELVVIKVSGKTITAISKNNGEISSKKGVNIPDTLLDASTFTKKDYEDINFAIAEKLDYVALSFIQTKKNIDHIRTIINSANSNIKIIAKIETNEAIENIEEIIAASDAIMVARGDLAIETSASQVPILQEKITAIARQQRKPVIIATHMLESMTTNPRATRAEISDIANAVLNQVDAVMLSAESASGKYPREAVKVMSETILSVEDNLEYKHYIRVNWDKIAESDTKFNAITGAGASLAYRIKSHVIAIATQSGRNALLLSSFRPDAHIIAITHTKSLCDQLSLLWGVNPLVIEPTKSSDKFWKEIENSVLNNQFAKKNDKIIIVGGTTIGISGATDTIKVATL